MSIRALTLFALLGLSAADARAGTRPDFDASLVARGEAAPVGAPASRPAVVHATEPSRGVPSLLWSVDRGPAEFAGLSPVAAARAHLAAHRERWGVSRETIDGAGVLFTHDTGRGGVIVAFRQRVGEVEVFHGEVKVLLDRANRLVAISGSPHPAAVAAAARPFARSQRAAIAAAVGDLHGRALVAADFVPAARGPRAGSHYFDLAPVSTPARGELSFAEPARVKPVYFPLGDSLVPAWLVEVQARRAPRSPLDVFQYAVAADTGAVLMRRDATAADAYTYRVWADEDGDHRPTDGPLVDFTPHPTGVPGEGPTEGTKPVYITVEGLNTNPDGEPDPWLPPGATETRGNHVDAYVDHVEPDGFNPDDGEFRASVVSPGVFDLDYDIGSEPLSSPAQGQAALVELFYVINWLHDWWYDSGFVEATGNAQQDNYGRGGLEGDPIRAEGQDGALEGKLNNANMSTPFDGGSPRMQMYLWTPRTNEGTLTVLPGAVAYEVAKAQFGPLHFDLEAPLVLGDDGTGGDPHDLCEAPTGDVAGKVVLVHRGTCTFETKVTALEAAGAVGVVISNNDADGFPPLGNDDMIVDPTIPTLGLTLADGEALEGALAGDSAAHMFGYADVQRDGTVDNMIIAHEYGHYIHHRLEDCGGQSCGAMSEGWADFTSLLMMLREGDPLDGVYAGVTYGGTDPAGYFGLRRVPYSVDTGKNALTFRHISDGEALPDGHPLNDNGIDNSEVHNAGEVWATMMWEVYVALHEAHAGDMSFAEVQRLMTDYVVGGMIMTPHDPTWTQQRDAILLAAAAASQDDFITIAGAFARRGAGSCAISPPADSVSLVGVTEDFQLQANGTLTALTLDDGAKSCDGDGVVDGGELGRIHVELANGGTNPLPAGSVVEVLSPGASLVFPDGPSVTIGALEPLESTSVDLAVALVPGLESEERVTVKVGLTTPEGCTSVKELTLPVVLNGDLALASAAVDDVETPESEEVWAIEGPGASIVWKRRPVSNGYAWRGENLGFVTDATLVSPVLQVSASEPLVVAFDHAHQFEFSEATMWDGGVVEVSTDGGTSWKDAADWAAVPYNGTIMSEDNPLHGRAAFGDKNEAYPGADHVEIDFGAKLAGQSIQVRFRLGTDGASGGPGWWVDNIAFSGIDNKPFAAWVPDQAACAGEESPTTSDSESGTTDGDDDDGTASETGGADDDDGCGCRSGAADARLAPLGLVLLALRRRRRR